MVHTDGVEATCASARSAKAPVCSVSEELSAIAYWPPPFTRQAPLATLICTAVGRPCVSVRVGEATTGALAPVAVESRRGVGAPESEQSQSDAEMVPVHVARGVTIMAVTLSMTASAPKGAAKTLALAQGAAVTGARFRVAEETRRSPAVLSKSVPDGAAHEVEPGGDKVPDAHGAHEELDAAPALAEKVLAAHGLQVAERDVAAVPLALAHVPGGHCVAAEPPAQ